MVSAHAIAAGVGAAVVAAALATGAPALATAGPPRQPARGAAPSLTLDGDGLMGLRFGVSRLADAVRTVDSLAGRAPQVQPSWVESRCGVDRYASWPGLTLDFDGGRLVGYASYPAKSAGLSRLATAKGLRADDNWATARGLYGSALHWSGVQGGNYWITTPHGTIAGFMNLGNDRVAAGDRLLSIGAGDEGCPAMSP